MSWDISGIAHYCLELDVHAKLVKAAVLNKYLQIRHLGAGMFKLLRVTD